MNVTPDPVNPPTSDPTPALPAPVPGTQPIAAPAIRPPSPEQFHAWLTAHPLSPPARGVWVGPVTVLLLGLIASLVIPGPTGLLLPWIALMGVVGWLRWRTMQSRELEGYTGGLTELAVLRRPGDALRRGWVVLPRLTQRPALHGRTVAVMSQCLAELGQYDAAVVGYDHVLSLLPPSHPAKPQLGLDRTVSCLMSERLTEAEDGLSRMRELEVEGPRALRANYRFARLLQAFMLHRDAEAVEWDASGDLLTELRPLGIEAGYGHALLALCHHRFSQREHEDEACRHEARARSAVWWGTAQQLLPVERLAARFPEVDALTEGDRDE